MSEPTTLKIIFVAHSAEAARDIARSVKEAGFTVKGKFAANLEMFESELQKQAWDGVLVSEQLPESLELTQIVATTNQHQANTPIIVMSDKVDENLRFEAMEAGARDAVSFQRPKLLGLILKPKQNHAAASAESTTETDIETEESVPVAATVTETVTPESLTEEEIVWLEHIKKALEDDRFVCVYQPIVNLNAEPASNYELLMRMLDEKGKEISPGAFLGVAEKAGLMNEIDRWVIKHAITAIKVKLEEDTSTRFFIKLSNYTLQDSGLIRWLSEQLHQAELPDHRLVFEITEEAAIMYQQSVKSLISAIKMNRCLVCLDRVGDIENYKELIFSLGLNYMKLSGHLIHDLANNNTNQHSIATIAGYAKEKNILTIAQFVQDPYSLAFLWQKGINYVQGYYLQRPDVALDYNFAQDDEGEIQSL